MFEDGRKTGGFEDDLEIVDVAELLIEAVEAGGPAVGGGAAETGNAGTDATADD
jgi:hypothetical protein